MSEPAGSSGVKMPGMYVFTTVSPYMKESSLPSEMLNFERMHIHDHSKGMFSFSCSCCDCCYFYGRGSTGMRWVIPCTSEFTPPPPPHSYMSLVNNMRAAAAKREEMRDERRRAQREAAKTSIAEGPKIEKATKDQPKKKNLRQNMKRRRQ